MPLKLLDEDWLRAHGLALPDEDLKLLTTKIYTELELRVGNKLADDMTSAELDEFDSLSDVDQLAWLEDSYPNYKDVVRRQLDILEVELQNAPDIQAAIETWAQP